MSNFGKVGSSIGTHRPLGPAPKSQPAIPVQTPPPSKPLPDIPQDMTSSPSLPPSGKTHDVSTEKELSSIPEVLSEVESDTSSSVDLQERTEDLRDMKQLLTESLSSTPVTITETDTVIPETITQTDMPKTSSPPRMSDHEITELLRSKMNPNDTSSTLKNMLSNLETFVAKHDRIELVTSDRDAQIKALDKKKQKYNGPLYRLADKLGFVNRKLKLKNVEANRALLEKSSHFIVKANRFDIDITSKEVKQDGKAFIEANKDNKGLMFDLSLKTKGQLRELVAQSLVSGMPNGDQLLSKYDELKQEYDLSKSDFISLQKETEIINDKVSNVKKQIPKMPSTTDDEKAAIAELRAKTNQELNDFDEKFIPIAKKWGFIGVINDKNTINYDSGDKFAMPSEPPSLFDALSIEQQGFVDSLVAGMQAGFPNRVLDDSSIMIDGKKYVNKTELGKGLMAKVYSYELEGDPSQKIAVKIPENFGDLPEKEFQEKYLDESVRELDVHYQAMGADGAGNKNVVTLTGAIQTDQGPMIAMEMVDGGNFEDLNIKMMGRLGKELTEQDHQLINKHMLYQMMSGVSHMHDGGMIHMDLKYDNFLIQSDGTIKVADFGMSTIKETIEFEEQGMTKTKEVGQLTNSRIPDNIKAIPPESVKGKAKTSFDLIDVTEKNDSWAIGTMAHVMLFGENHRLNGKFPYLTEANIKEFGEDFSNRIFPQPAPPATLTPEQELINGLMHPDPTQRLSLSDAMKLPVFNDIFEGGGRETVKQSVKDLVVHELKA